ncbi:3770_t:CDS:2, partial [Racocetra persica]
DLGEVKIKHVLKGSGTGKITKILNNDNFLICKLMRVEKRELLECLEFMSNP